MKSPFHNNDHHRFTRHKRGGYVMFEIVIAVAIFSLAITGIVVALNASIDAALLVRQEAEMLTKLQNRLEEARFQPMEEGTFADEEPDPQGVLFYREMEPLEFETEDEVIIDDIWRLRIIAEWQDPTGKKQTAHAEIWTRDNSTGG